MDATSFGAVGRINHENCSHWPNRHIGNGNRLAKFGNALSRKVENYAASEVTRLRKSGHGKLRLIGTAIGILVVFLPALRMAYHA